jgi:hypothetical protein
MCIRIAEEALDSLAQRLATELLAEDAIVDGESACLDE